MSQDLTRLLEQVKEVKKGLEEEKEELLTAVRVSNNYLFIGTGYAYKGYVDYGK